MNKRIYSFYLLVFCTFTIEAQIVNDTVKFLFGTNTTKLFTQETVYGSRIRYYNKDTVFRPNASYLLAINDSLLNDSLLKIKRQVYKYDTLNIKKRDSLELAFKKRFYRSEYTYTKLDTGLTNFHNYNYLYINDNIHQNLGLIGTASKPVFFVRPTELGYQTGFDAFDLYLKEPKTMPYYNSRSAVTRFDYMANSGDENRIYAELNRNITKNWNVGFSYQRINSNKQFAKSGRDNNNLIGNQDFKLYTSGKSKNERYHFMGSFTYFVTKQNEQGGMISTNPFSSTNNTINQNAPPQDVGSWQSNLLSEKSYLEPARTQGSIYSRDRRIIWHFYQQYDLVKQGKLSFFHEFNHRNQKIRYADPINSSSSRNNFYPEGKDTSKIFFNTEYLTISNKIGLKTMFNNFVVLGFIKHRKVQQANNLDVLSAFGNPFKNFDGFFLSGNSKSSNLVDFHETYLGGEIGFTLPDSLSEIRIRAEKLLLVSNIGTKQFNAINNNEYLLDFYFKYKHFAEIGFTNLLTSPSLKNSYINHNNFSWNYDGNNGFKPQVTLSAYIKTNYRFSRVIYSKFKFSSDLIANYMYLDTAISPKQAQNSIWLNSFDVTLGTDRRGFNFDFFGKLNLKVDLDNVYRQPVFYGSAKVFYKIVPAKKRGNQQFMIGLDFHYRTSYYGDAYMPAIAAFYLQNDFNLQNVHLLDAFVNVKLKNARVFARYNQINTFFGNLIEPNGYYVTPFYPSVRPFLSFGFTWYLFE